MNKITIKKAIEFTKRTKRGKASMIQKLKFPSAVKADGGGDYWIRSLSAITKSCRDNDPTFIINKIEEIKAAKKTTGRKQTLDMYNRNLDILSKFEFFDFEVLKPEEDITYLGGLKMNSIISTQGIPLQIVPSLVFTYLEDETPTVGAILFVAKLEEFKSTELAMICEALYRNIKANYGNSYAISRDFCTVVDVIYETIMQHSGLNNRLVSRELNLILREIRDLL